MNNLPEQKKLPIEYLKRGQFQPRKFFDSAKLDELAETIKQQGLIQPIVVRPISENAYEILAGERRWRAAQRAMLAEVPVLIRHDVNDESAIEIAIIENIQRENLSPIEEAEVYERLNYEFGYTHEEIGHKIGKDRVTVTNKLRLLKLNSKVKKMLSDCQLAESFGLQLASLSENEQYPIAQLCYKNSWSIRKLQKEIRNFKANSEGNDQNKKANYDADIIRLQQKLSDNLGTTVTLQHNEKTKSGKVIIIYDSTDILDGLLEKWNVSLDD
jgi:ParB family transcriptional regulator, chromosome partitioning protein